MKKDKKSKKIDDGYGDDLMSWVARFLVANDGRAPESHPNNIPTFCRMLEC